MTIRPAMIFGLAPIFLRLRHGLLVLLCLAFVAGFILHPPSWFLGGAVVLGAAVAWAQFRYFRLALVVALAPLAGVFWLSAAYYPFALALAALMASGLAHRLLRGSTEEDAFAALFDPVPGLIGAVLVGLGWSFWGRANSDALLLAALSVLLALPIAAIFLPFGEQFHIAANRARETREPLAQAAAQLVQPRWALSLCGITLVFLVLALFQRPVWPAPLDWLGCVLVAMVLHATTLDWRSAVAGLVCAILLLLTGEGMTAALPLFVLLSLFLAGGRAVNWALAMEERAVPLFFAGMGAALATAILGGPGQGLLALAAAAAALFAFPALTALQHHLWPLRRSIEELYGD